MINRAVAPNISVISEIKTYFPESDNNLFKIHSEEGVFKLDIIYPDAGQVNGRNKFAIAMAINLLLAGDSNKKADEIAENIDALGGFVFKSSDFYNASITIYGLNEYINETVQIVKNAIDTANYPQYEIDIYKRNRLSELEINKQKTSYLAGKGIHKILLGAEHDISFETTEDIIHLTKREDLIEFKTKHLNSPYFIFTGAAVTPIEEILSQNNFKITTHRYQPHIDMPINNSGEKNLFISKSATQNSIRYGAVWPKRGHQDYFKLSLLNLILGGYFGSRLMKNIREDKGLTYGIQSSLTPYNDFSLFKISCEYNSNFTKELQFELDLEINRLKTELVDHLELITAKNYLLGAMLRSFDGAFPVSEKFKQFQDSNLQKDYYQSYFQAINETSSEDIKEVANNYLKENTLTYCIAGV